MHVTAIIAAGGAGLRLGAGVPKQLLEVGGLSMLQRSVKAFGDIGSDESSWRCRRSSRRTADSTRGVAGVPGRWRGAAAGLGGERVQGHQSGRRVVLIHDAARPLVTGDLIIRTIQAAARHGAAIAAQPVSDTVKRVRRMRDGVRGRRDDSPRVDFPGADAAGISR
jgi:2-C-methyl-D-erythritol 4-phosphate cytidylyltransferase